MGAYERRRKMRPRGRYIAHSIPRPGLRCELWPWGNVGAFVGDKVERMRESEFDKGPGAMYNRGRS